MGNSFGRKKSFNDIQTVHRLREQRHEQSFAHSAMKLFCFLNHSNRNHRRALSKEKGRELFSEYEIQLVRESWVKVGERNENFGLDVYRRIFECEPSMKMLFSWRNVTTDKIIDDPQFRRQAAAIMSVIDKCVQSMDKLETTRGWLEKLGKFHTKLRGYGFKPEHWVLFKLSILLSLAFVLDDTLNRHDLLEAWNTLITFIVETMKQGFNDGVKGYFEANAITQSPRRYSAE